jgi:hypothetical protein
MHTNNQGKLNQKTKNNIPFFIEFEEKISINHFQCTPEVTDF